MTIVAAGCGAAKKPTGNASGAVEAIRSGAALGTDPLPTATTVSCSPSHLGVDGSYDCRVTTAKRDQWYLCFTVPNSGATYGCALTNAPPGIAVFTTPETRAARKEVDFKCEDVDDAGENIGPVFISIAGRVDSPTQELDWMTEAAARKVARRYGVPLGLDC